MIVPIILCILKIIGIVLLCILGQILLLLLVVLFVPIRYKVIAESDISDINKDYHLTAKISWLLWLVHGKYEYPSDDGFVLKVGPFTVYGGKEKPEKKKKVKMKKQTKEENVTGEIAKTEVDNYFEDEEVFNEEYEERSSKAKLTDNESQEKTGRKSLKEKILYTWKKICDKIIEIRVKIKSVFANIKKYLNIIQSNEFKEAFALCKNSLVRLFRMIKPRKVKVNGTIGMKSPDQTGYVCGAIGLISTFFKNQIHVLPDFENFIIKGNVLMKGRIYLFVVLIIAIKAFFDKNIREVIEMFRKEETVNE